MIVINSKFYPCRLLTAADIDRLSQISEASIPGEDGTPEQVLRDADFFGIVCPGVAGFYGQLTAEERQNVVSQVVAYVSMAAIGMRISHGNR